MFCVHSATGMISMFINNYLWYISRYHLLEPVMKEMVSLCGSQQIQFHPRLWKSRIDSIGFGWCWPLTNLYVHGYMTFLVYLRWYVLHRCQITSFRYYYEASRPSRRSGRPLCFLASIHGVYTGMIPFRMAQADVRMVTWHVWLLASSMPDTWYISPTKIWTAKTGP